MSVSFRSFFFSVCLLGSVSLLAACDESGSGGAADQGPMAMMAQMPPPAVSVVEVSPERVVLTTTLSGRTTAYRQAEVRPQVTGILQQRLFEEGSTVAEGQQLYQIDSSSYEAAFESADAALAKAEANLKAVQAKADRYASLVEKNAVSRQDYDDIMASLDQARAEILAAEAARKAARINLDYTQVYAPISGRTGRSMVSEGALVTANQQMPLTTITQLDPIYVDLTQSSTDMARLHQLIRAHSLAEEADITEDAGSEANRAEAEQPEPVLVTLVEDGAARGFREKGQLQFSEVTVDPSTGNVQLRAVFPNPGAQLLPGMFVRARVETGVRDDALLVPQQAVVRQPDGSAVVWTVGEDSKVSPRPVTVGESIGGRWLIEEGLRPGDRVVTEGLQKLQPGAPVRMGDSAGTADPAGAAGTGGAPENGSGSGSGAGK